MTYKPDSAVTYIVIHYSATAIERDYTAADIDDMHRKRGFKEIGYHYFIRKDGTVEVGRDLSKPGRFEMGAHSKGENDESVGICYEGGVKAVAPNIGFDSRTPAQTKAMIALILALKERFPRAVVKGHRDMPGAATQCPGFDVTPWWDGVIASRSAPPIEVAPVVPVPTSPDRVTPLQSTTIWAQIKQWVVGMGPAGYAAWAALQEQDPTTRYIILGGLVVAIFYVAYLGRHIIRERMDKWARGVR